MHLRPEQDTCRTAADVLALAREHNNWRRRVMHVRREKEPPSLPIQPQGHYTPPNHLEREFKKRLSVVDIQRFACLTYGVSRNDLCCHRRDKRAVRIRHITMWLCKMLLPIVYEAIGERFSLRDHSSVVKACKKIQAHVDKYDEVGREALWMLDSAKNALGVSKDEWSELE